MIFGLVKESAGEGWASSWRLHDWGVRCDCFLLFTRTLPTLSSRGSPAYTRLSGDDTLSAAALPSPAAAMFPQAALYFSALAICGAEVRSSGVVRRVVRGA